MGASMAKSCRDAVSSAGAEGVQPESRARDNRMERDVVRFSIIA